MKMKEMREMEPKDREKQLKEYRHELMNLRFQHATAQLENTQRIPYVKKSIARLLTLENERKKVESHD